MTERNSVFKANGAMFVEKVFSPNTMQVAPANTRANLDSISATITAGKLAVSAIINCLDKIVDGSLYAVAYDFVSGLTVGAADVSIVDGVAELSADINIPSDFDFSDNEQKANCRVYVFAAGEDYDGKMLISQTFSTGISWLSNGNTGDSGDSGDTGGTGDSGDNGNTGDTGDNGDSGGSGDTGDNGDSSGSGDTGDNGNSGNGGVITRELAVELYKLECTLDDEIFQTTFEFGFDEILINYTVEISVKDIVKNVVIASEQVSIVYDYSVNTELPVPVGFNTAAGSLLNNCRLFASITGNGINGEKFVSQTFSCPVSEMED